MENTKSRVFRTIFQNCGKIKREIRTMYFVMEKIARVMMGQNPTWFTMKLFV